jgi:hypothetical protein
VKARGWILVLAPLSGCVSPSNVGVAGGGGGSRASTTVGGRNGSNGGETSSTRSGSSGAAGSSSLGGSSSSSGTSIATGGSSSGGASTSNIGNGVCPTVSLPDAGGCSTGYYVSQEVDILSCAPIAGGTMQALDANGTPAPGSVTTAADGTFVLCAPAGTAFTPFLSAPGYLMYVGELQAGTGNSYVDSDAVSTGDLALLVSFLPGGVNSELGTLIVSFDTSSNCPDPSGWSLSLTSPDGGPFPDGGYRLAYLGPSDVPDPALTSTSSLGAAFFYDIDLSNGNYVSLAESNPDAGGCLPVIKTAFTTGRYYVAANACTVATLQVP